MTTQSDFFSSRRLRRLYSDRDISSLDEVLLSPEESHHALKVLRIQPGELCLIVDGSGCEAESRLEAVKDQCAFFKILSLHREARGFSVPVAVFPALIKKGKMDTLVEKAQEFGVSSFHPVRCERSEFEVSADRFQAVATRWEKIAKESAKQSGAGQVLKIENPNKFEKVLASLEPEALTLLFHTHDPAEDWTQVADKISAQNLQFQKVNVLIGPEGGFSSKEIQCALDLKYPNLKIVRMVATVLKADTAFIAALAGINFFLRGKASS